MAAARSSSRHHHHRAPHLHLTDASASLVIPRPLEGAVWPLLRDFVATMRLLAGVATCELSSGASPFELGAQRRVTWRTGETRVHSLLSLNDSAHTIEWELLEAEPPVESKAIMTRITCIPVTETNSSYVQWHASYSSRVSSKFIERERQAFQSNLRRLSAAITGVSLPVLYHVHEAPSTRVVWLAAELGVLVQRKESSVRRRRSAELQQLPSGRASLESSTSEGGLVTSFTDNDVSMLESGAVVQYLLEKYDREHRLSPRVGSPLRPAFLHTMFYVASTVDHVLIRGYECSSAPSSTASATGVVTASGSANSVSSDAASDAAIVAAEAASAVADAALSDRLKEEWLYAIEPVLERQIHGKRFVLGDEFSAADIMLGYALHLALLLGYLSQESPLVAYFHRLRARPHFGPSFGYPDAATYAFDA